MSAEPLPTELIELPFPPASLSGHNTGHWRKKSAIVAKHREWAIKATLAIRNRLSINLADNSDIRIGITFYPPDRRGDRCNYPNRMKPYLDGIADALCVNDRRFLPTYHFAEPVKNARVVVAIQCSAAMQVAA
jgi:crossover junction endodeoxyribonuclease RusA